MITQRFVLHMVPDVVRPTVYVSQRSSGLEKLQFTLVGTNGQYYQIPDGTSVTLVGTKPDKKPFSYACTYSGNTVVCDITEQMTAVAGIVTAELRFANTSGEMIPSQNIDIVVERSPLADSICSKADLISVEDEIESISQDAANSKKYAKEAKEAGEQAVSVANKAKNELNNTKNEAISEVNGTKEDAIDSINSKSAETMAKFDTAVDYCREYGTVGVAMEYINSTESFRITSVTD